MAVKMLEQAVAAFGIGSEEGKAILSAHKTLSKKFGSSEGNTQQLMPAELRHMIAEFAGPGMPGGNPGAGAPPGGPPQPGAAAPQ